MQVSTKIANTATSSKACASNLGFGLSWGWYLRDLGGSQEICEVNEDHEGHESHEGPGKGVHTESIHEHSIFAGFPRHESHASPDHHEDGEEQGQGGDDTHDHFGCC